MTVPKIAKNVHKSHKNKYHQTWASIYAQVTLTLIFPEGEETSKELIIDSLDIMKTMLFFKMLIYKDHELI